MTFNASVFPFALKNKTIVYTLLDDFFTLSDYIYKELCIIRLP